ncbi:hypothetical protein ACLI4Z_09800 [Natrialbaceae archaeon A-arb3/5]
MAQQPLAATTRSVSRGASVAASAGLGVLAAAIGYLVTYVLIVDEVGEAVGENVAEWMGVAWYYYNAHLVNIETSGEFGGISGADTVNFIAESGSTSSTLLYVVPPVVLAVIGAVLAYQLDARDIGEGVLVGAPVAIGYAVVMGLGAVVAESSTEASFFGIEATGSTAPLLVPAIVLGGLLYPLVFATAGAILTAVLR